MPWIPIAIAAASAIYGAVQQGKANSALKALQAQPRPQYQTGEQVYDKSRSLATGLSPTQWAGGINQLNQLSNTRYKLGIQRNPNLSGAVQAGVNYGNVQGVLGLAGKDADVYQQNLRSLTGLIGGQSNMQTRNDLSYRDNMERAYGAAAQAGVKNEFNGAQQAGEIYYNYDMNQRNQDFQREMMSRYGVPYGQRRSAQTNGQYIDMVQQSDGSYA